MGLKGLFALGTILFLLFSGCAFHNQSPRQSGAEGASKESQKIQEEKAPIPTKQTFAPTELGGGYALLDQLLSDEKNLSKILIIKKVSPQVSDLIKAISERTKSANKEIDLFFPHGKELEEQLGLPPFERLARASLGKRKQSELLHAKGAQFEKLLLITQVEALYYAVALCDNLTLVERDESKRLYLQKLGTDLDHLLSRAKTLL